MTEDGQKEELNLKYCEYANRREDCPCRRCRVTESGRAAGSVWCCTILMICGAAFFMLQLYTAVCS